MKKLNNYTKSGLGFIAISLISSRFSIIPDFFEGFFSGIGIIFLLISLYSKNHDISKFRSNKRNFIKKCLNR